jgi:bifunctional DNase/RNase
MLIRVEVTSFGIEPGQNIPLIILREIGGERSLPILIGSAEASAIAIKALDINSERPLTIDMAKLILLELGGTLERVVVYDLIDQTFYARLHIATGKSMHLLDCRPSDAIALALRCDCPIFVEDSVFDKNENKKTLSEKEKLKRSIANLDTLDFGRYYMD